MRSDQTFTITGTATPPTLVPILAFIRREFGTEPVVIATATADAQGEFQVDARLPAETPPGVHTIQVQGRASCAAQVRIVGDATITPVNPGGRSSGLAFTGANPLVLVLIALVVLTIGFVLVAGERRHRTRRTTIRRERRARREHRDQRDPRDQEGPGEEREPTLVG